MSLERRSGQALWLQIEAALAREINEGRLGVGDRLPTEPELMERFDVSRSTVRQAIASLERRGLVRAEQGRGTFVRGRVLTYALSSRTRFSRNLIEQGFDPAMEKILDETIPAGPEVGGKLEIPEWQSVAHRRGMARADGMPVELGDAWVPLDRFPDFWTVRARHATVSGAFAAFGVRDYVRKSTLIEARLPTEEEAVLLEQPRDSPVFVVTRLDADLKGRPILFGRSLWPSDRVVFDVTLGG